MSKTRKIISIIGARPQFIKAATVSREFEASEKLDEIIIHTGQHFDTNMSDIFFDELEINKPAYNLNIGGGTHGENTGRMIESIEKLLFKEKPDIVLVYGDTDSTLSGAIAATKLNIPLVHIEAGLRSFNRKMPEEINRVLTDHAADILFTPTESASEQLLKEGISEDKVVFSGDVMFDATRIFGTIASKRNIDDLKKLTKTPYALLTMHRAENVDYKAKIQNIFTALSESGLNFIFPIHPRTKKNIKNFELKVPKNVTEIPPVGYLDMLYLERNASLIMTDSGGVQKEAYFNSVPCITLRTETEWVELVDAGVNFITSDDKEKILNAIEQSNKLAESDFNHNFYGDGHAAKKIVDYLSKV
jgi:UDP-GlcNAc3NAcA epimerase